MKLLLKMINIPQIREAIDDTLLAMGERFYSKHASDAVFETGLVESRYEYIKQLAAVQLEASGR